MLWMECELVEQKHHRRRDGVGAGDDGDHGIACEQVPRGVERAVGAGVVDEGLCDVVGGVGALSKSLAAGERGNGKETHRNALGHAVAAEGRHGVPVSDHPVAFQELEADLTDPGD